MTAIVLAILATITALIGLITSIFKHFQETRKKASDLPVHPALGELHVTLRNRPDEFGFGGPKTAYTAAGILGAAAAVALVDAVSHASDLADNSGDALNAASDAVDWFTN